MVKEEEPNIKNEKARSDSKKTIFAVDSSDSDSSVGSFFLKRSAEMRGTKKKQKTTSTNESPNNHVVTPSTIVIKSSTSANKGSPVIDLTGSTGKPELPGPVLSLLKEQNNVYWTYDPLGIPKEEDLDWAYYCRECRCPFHYCAQHMFGKVVTEQVEYLLKEKNEPDDITYDWLKVTFYKVYWDLVHHKKMMNLSPFPPGYTFPTHNCPPACIKLIYMNNLFRKYGKVCSRNRDKDL